MISNFCKSSLALTVFAAISTTILPAQSALLVSSGGDNSIKQYDETTGEYIRDFVTSGSGGLLNPQGLAIGTNSNLFVSSSDTNSIKEYNGTTGEYIGDFVSSSSGLLDPNGLTFGADGSLFVTSSSIPGSETPGTPGERRSGVLQYDTTGELLNTISTGFIGELVRGPQPVDVVLGGPDNTLFVSSDLERSNRGDVSEYDPTTGASIGFGVGPDFFNPGGLAIGGNFLYYTESVPNPSIGRIDLVNKIIDPLFVNPNLSEFVIQFEDVAIGENGNLFVSDSISDSIKQYDGITGDFLGDFIASGSGSLDRPTYLTTANVPVPEPSSVLGIMGFSGLFAGSILRRRISNRKQLPSLQK